MMPLSSSGLAPRFTGNPYKVLTFLQTVDQLGQDNGLPDKDLIKYALRYTVPEEREVWEFYDTCTGDNFTDFANKILGMYPCGEDRYYTGPANPTFSETPDPLSRALRASDPMPRNPEPAAPVVPVVALHVEIPVNEPAPQTPAMDEEVQQTVKTPDNPTISDAPAPANPNRGNPLVAVETLDMFTEVIGIDVLTLDISSLDPKSLGDANPGKPEISAPDYPDIWDIDIGVLDYEPEISAPCHPDITDTFVLAATVLLLTGYILWYRFSMHPTNPKTRPASPQTRTLGPAFPALSDPQNPLFRHPAHPHLRNRYQHPVYGFYQYPRPSHSRMALTRYECGRRAQIRKKQ